MRKLWKPIVLLAAIVVMVIGVLGSGAWFSDKEVSPNNTFVAGTLDLKVNGADTPVTIFNVKNMKPGDQPSGSITLNNTGSIGGNLSISDVSVKNSENGCGEPEIEAGDLTCANPGPGVGELQNVLNLRLYIDTDSSGYISAGDIMLYEGLMKNLGSTIPISQALAANGGTTKLNYVIDWWDKSSDNLAQSDGVEINMTFGLKQ